MIIADLLLGVSNKRERPQGGNRSIRISFSFIPAIRGLDFDKILSLRTSGNWHF